MYTIQLNHLLLNASQIQGQQGSQYLSIDLFLLG